MKLKDLLFGKEKLRKYDELKRVERKFQQYGRGAYNPLCLGIILLGCNSPTTSKKSSLTLSKPRLPNLMRSRYECRH